MKLFLQKNAKFSKAGGSAPRPLCLRQQPPAARAPHPDPPNSPSPLRISGYAPALIGMRKTRSVRILALKFSGAPLLWKLTGK